MRQPLATLLGDDKIACGCEGVRSISSMLPPHRRLARIDSARYGTMNISDSLTNERNFLVELYTTTQQPAAYPLRYKKDGLDLVVPKRSMAIISERKLDQLIQDGDMFQHFRIVRNAPLTDDEIRRMVFEEKIDPGKQIDNWARPENRDQIGPYYGPKTRTIDEKKRDLLIQAGFNPDDVEEVDLTGVVSGGGDASSVPGGREPRTKKVSVPRNIAFTEEHFVKAKTMWAEAVGSLAHDRSMLDQARMKRIRELEDAILHILEVRQELGWEPTDEMKSFKPFDRATLTESTAEKPVKPRRKPTKSFRQRALELLQRLEEGSGYQITPLDDEILRDKKNLKPLRSEYMFKRRRMDQTFPEILAILLEKMRSEDEINGVSLQEFYRIVGVSSPYFQPYVVNSFLWRCNDPRGNLKGQCKGFKVVKKKGRFFSNIPEPGLFLM